MARLMASTPLFRIPEVEEMGNLALATILVGAALAASMISIELGISAALIELGLGVVVGNVFDVTTPDWLVFLAGFAGRHREAGHGPRLSSRTSGR